MKAKSLCCFFSTRSKTKFAHGLLFIAFALLFNSCGIYTFNGASLSPDLKTIAISNFISTASGGPANLAQTFTEKIKEYYQRNTSLKLTTLNPDLSMDGSISSYDVTPVAPSVSSTGPNNTSVDRAALNRLTVTIQVHFANNKDETKNFDQSFSFYQDFPQTQTINQVEGSLIPKILDQIVLDIFNKSAGDW